MRWYGALVLSGGVLRVAELAVSARRERSVRGRQAAARTFPAMVAVNVALFTVPLVEVAALHRRPRLPALWMGLLGGATLLRWWSIATLGAAWNVRAVVPEDLRPVTGGPYRWIRHPNYLAVIVEFLALPMAGGAWISAIALSVLNGIVLWDRIAAEERLLAESPGYMDTVGRRARLLPGLV